MNKLNLYFWQNCVSPHQLPYISELAVHESVNKVYYIAPTDDLQERKKMGWDVMSFKNADKVEFIIAPTIDTVNEILANSGKESYHFFSGIRADHKVYQYFLASLEFDLMRGIIVEAPYTYDKPLFLHKLRFLMQDYKYVSDIDFVFAIGENSVAYYKSWSNKWSVVPFAYCVNAPSARHDAPKNSVCRFVYIGSLIKRKNVKLLLDALTRLPQQLNVHLDIIGDGDQAAMLKNFVQKHNLQEKVTFLGMKQMDEIHEQIHLYDSLVLPSLYDGWGAVVNEALHSGLMVVCSDRCGAKTLIESSGFGYVFKTKNANDLSACLGKVVDAVCNEEVNRNEIVSWSEKIAGKSIANYFVGALAQKSNIKAIWEN